MTYKMPGVYRNSFVLVPRQVLGRLLRRADICVRIPTLSVAWSKSKLGAQMSWVRGECGLVLLKKNSMKPENPLHHHHPLLDLHTPHFSTLTHPVIADIRNCL